MKVLGFFLNILFIVLVSCSTNSKSDFLTIPVDVGKNMPLCLSEIAENIEAIELELTDESLIKNISYVSCTTEFVFVNTQRRILLFDKAGKFIRRIGSSGQGPGEFLRFWNFAIDKKDIYISTTHTMICYDFDGNFKKELPSLCRGMNYIYNANDELLLLSESIGTHNDNKRNVLLYFMDDDLSKIDSIEVSEEDFGAGMWYSHNYKDFITAVDNQIYLYYSGISPDSFIPDTLYQIKDRKIIPHLNLNIKNKDFDLKGKSGWYIYSMYRSSRYVFALYQTHVESPHHCFCYDIKSGEGHNMKGGYMDDIYTGKQVIIRPFSSDANKFYYLHTNIDDSINEEPNPTLYIGTLKK